MIHTTRTLNTAVILAAAWLLTACAAPKPSPTTASANTATARTASSPANLSVTGAAPACTPAAPSCAPCVCDQAGSTPVVPAPKPEWTRAAWNQLANWDKDRHAEAWRAFLASCSVLTRQPAWARACAEAETAAIMDAKGFFERQFTPWRMSGAASSMVTGYYEPLLNGSRTRRAPYLTPLYAAPSDLLTIDLGDLRPDLKGQRLRGRLDGNRVVPYYDRAAIDGGKAPVAGRELVYVDDPVEAFFLEVQGSGRIKLDTGETVRLNYANQNGHPYRSIGRYLIDKGELKLEQASMQGIRAWAKANPARLNELLHANPSYVFFRESEADARTGPQGAMGLPLTTERSIAVDPAFVPLGAPVWLVTTYPNTTRPLERLMLAQDTGGAIRGPQRADFFWGFGDEAGREAGRMRQTGELWLLWPNGFEPAR